MEQETHPKNTMENLLKVFSAREIGNELDETLCDLVHYAGREEEYAPELANRYFLIRKLRDLFWEMAEEK